MSELSLSLEQRGFEYGVKHLMTPTSGPLLKILAEALAITSEEISHLLYLGAIYVQGQRLTENLEIAADTYVRVHTKPRRFPPNHFAWSQKIIFENENFVAVDKPSGLPCHPSVDNTRENILSYLSESLHQDFFLTHRLDVPTNGILILAKNKEFQSAFNTLLKDRGLEKIYRAICTKKMPPLGLQRHYMQPSPRAPKTLTDEAQAGYVVCELEILSTQSTAPEESETKIKLLTGRTHQIRAQLSYLGSPIKNDILYGATKDEAADKIHLTACELKFTDPLTQEPHHFKI